MIDLIEKFVQSHRVFDDTLEELNTQISKKEQKISALQRQLEKLKEKKKRLRSPMPWTDVLLDIKDELESLSGFKAEFGGPFGIRAEFILSLIDPAMEDKYSGGYCLTVTPDIIWCDDPHRVIDLKFYYDTGETTNDFCEGSIGARNGMNNKTALLPLDAKQIFEIMKTKKVNKTTIL